MTSENMANEKLIYETERLGFRYWTMDDAERCFELASDEHVGPPCGWNPHKSLEETENILKNVLVNNHTFCIIEKSSGEIIGNMGIDNLHDPGKPISGSEKELGFWLGYPYWNKGYMTEAVLGTIDYCFNVLGIEKLWCGYFPENPASGRVQEKCGFKYQYTYEAYFTQLKENREVRESLLSK